MFYNAFKVEKLLLKMLINCNIFTALLFKKIIYPY